MAQTDKRNAHQRTPTQPRAPDGDRRELVDALRAAQADADAARVESRDASAKAAAACRAKDEFLAMLNHELRNPLSTVFPALELLKLRVGVTPELAIIERQVRQISRLISDLLDLAQLTCGEIDLRRDLVEIARVTAAAADAVRPALDEHAQALHIDVRDGELFVRADEARLAHVLTSLLTNAVRFSPRGTHIVVTIERIGTSGAICVRDEGLGLSREALAENFDPCVQHEQTLARPSTGLGLGLTIARLVADVTGGTLTASSEGPGAGSAFVLTLPLVAADGTDGNAGVGRP